MVEKKHPIYDLDLVAHDGKETLIFRFRSNQVQVVAPDETETPNFTFRSRSRSSCT